MQGEKLQKLPLKELAGNNVETRTRQLLCSNLQHLITLLLCFEYFHLLLDFFVQNGPTHRKAWLPETSIQFWRFLPWRLKARKGTISYFLFQSVTRSSYILRTWYFLEQFAFVTAQYSDTIYLRDHKDRILVRKLYPVAERSNHQHNLVPI